MPVFNRILVTRRFISCLKKQTNQNFHLIVIDDGSTDGTSDFITKELKNSTILKGNGNLWWGGSLHKGYKWVKKNLIDDDNFILIINNDTEFDGNFLQTGINLLNLKDKTIYGAQCHDKYTGLLFDKGVTINWKNMTYNQAVHPEFINCLSTRGLFLKLKDYLEIGGLHPVLLPHYGSDYEYTIRAKTMGYTLLTTDTLRVWTDDKNKRDHDYLSSGLFHYLKTVFSKKKNFKDNPIYYCIFIILTSPRKLIIKNCFRIIKEWILEVLVVCSIIKSL